MSTEIVPVEPQDLAATPRPSDAGHVDVVEMVLNGLMPESRAGYLKDLKAFAGYAGGPTVEHAVRSLLRLDRGAANALMASYLGEMEAKGLSPATLRRRAAAVKRVFKQGRRFGLCDVVPEPELPKAEAYNDVTGPGESGWNKMHARAIVGAADGSPLGLRDLAVVLLLHDRGLRRGEVVSADYPEDWDRERPAIQVRRKGHRLKEWLTLSDRAGRAVANWLAVRGAWPGPLFTRCDRAGKGIERLSGQAVNELVRRLAKGAAVKRTVRAHGLRHQVCTELLDRGESLQDVRAFMGHANVNTTLIYEDRRKDVGGELSRVAGGEGRRKVRGRRARGN